jgi:hypothetical protein
MPMNKRYAALCTSFFLLCIAVQTFAQQPLVSDAKKAELSSFSAQLRTLSR